MKPAQFLLLLPLVGFIPCAHAYIDPGSGSFMLQMLIASLIGASLTIKMFFQNIKAKFKSIFGHKDKKADNLTDEKSNPQH